jgi:fucose 4-O-acetylase-like acetyltransferase
MNNTQSKKDLIIETLRGLAIFLMVLGHIIGSTADVGLKVPDGSGWRFFYYTFQFIRMPLFTVISGYVYAYKPLSRFPSTGKFIGRKVNRLLVPLLVVSTIFFLVQYITPGTNSKVRLGEIWEIYLFQYAHFWFLQGMIVVFLIVTLLERYHLLQTLKSSLICLFVIAFIFFIDVPLTRFFSLNSVPFLLSFFILGLSLKRFHEKIFTKTNIIIAAVVFTFAMAYQLYAFDQSPLPSRLETGLTLAVGSTACMLLIWLGLQNEGLVWLGNFSFGIYLFHVFGTAACRIVLMKLHVSNQFIHVIGGLMLGLGLPILLQLVIPKGSVLALLFFGDKVNSQQKRTAVTN